VKFGKVEETYLPLLPILIFKQFKDEELCWSPRLKQKALLQQMDLLKAFFVLFFTYNVLVTT